MVILRCTQKLLRRLHVTNPGDGPKSTTALGDWHGKLLFTPHARVVLFISELSRLPVVLPARNLSNLARTFPAAVREVLQEIGVPTSGIDREVEAMSELAFGLAKSRSLLGSLNDFGYHLAWELETKPDVKLVELAVRLSEIPCGPLNDQQPREVTLRLLSNRL